MIQRHAQIWFFSIGCSNSFFTRFWVRFWRKIFLMIYSINWRNFIVWLSLLLEILDNVCIAILCFQGFDAINFEIDLIFLIKSFFYLSKKSWRASKYLENKKAFKVKAKAFFITFKELSITKSSRRPESRPIKFIFLFDETCGLFDFKTL